MEVATPKTEALVSSGLQILNMSQELKLGMLQGNRFDIILRNVQASGEDIVTAERQQQVLEHAANSLKDKGFINYVGTQWFGKFKDCRTRKVSRGY